MPKQGGLDLTQLDPIATALDHPIAPPEEAVIPVVFLHDDIARSIPSCRGIVEQEGLVGSLG